MSAPLPPLLLASLALLLAACEIDSDSTGGKPTLGDGTGDTGTGPTTATDDDDVGVDETGPPPPIEGARRRRLDIAAAHAGAPGGATVMVRLDASRIEYEDTQPGGADLQFFAADEVTRYPAEIERWDPGGSSVIWVRIDAVELPDHFWMYYGDGVDHPPDAAAEAWDGAFAAVWHMQIGEAAGLPDSSGGGHELEPFDFAGELDVPGYLGLAASFESNGSLEGPLRLSDPDEILLDDAMTLEAWISQAEVVPTGPQFALIKGGSYDVLTLEPNNNLPRVTVRSQISSTGVNASGVLGPTWTYLAATYRADDGMLTIFRNGQPEMSISVPGTAEERIIATSDQLIQVGRNFDGMLDEVRISTIARSPAWIGLQHASMSDQLLSFGAPEGR